MNIETVADADDVDGDSKLSDIGTFQEDLPSLAGCVQHLSNNNLYN